MARYLPDGAIDNSFSGGTVTLDPVGLLRVGMARQSDGKLVLVSEFGGKTAKCLVTRVNSDGNLDNSFGDAGKKLLALSDKPTQNSTVDAVLVQPDGNILIAGSAQTGDAAINSAMLARLTAAGELDTSFGVSGRAVTVMEKESAKFSALALQRDGRIIAIGSVQSAIDGEIPAVARFDVQGNLDATFNGGGFLTIDPFQGSNNKFFEFGSSVAIQPDGKIVVAGDNAGFDTILMRINGADGTLDTQFGNQGVSKVALLSGSSSSDFATSLVLQADGKFVIAGEILLGQFAGAFVARLNTNTLIDRSFSGGIVTPAIGSVGVPGAEFQAAALDEYGRIIAVGVVSSVPPQILVNRLWP